MSAAQNGVNAGSAAAASSKLWNKPAVGGRNNHQLATGGKLTQTASGATVMIVEDDDDFDDDVDYDHSSLVDQRLFKPDWNVLTNEYEQVDWRKIEGQNFMSKMEMLLGCLTKTNFSTSSNSPATGPGTHGEKGSA